MEFAPQPALLGRELPGLLHYPVPTGKLVGDTYLAAFSIAGGMRLVTSGQGFRQFRGVDPCLIGA